MQIHFAAETKINNEKLNDVHPWPGDYKEQNGVRVEVHTPTLYRDRNGRVINLFA